MTAISKNVYFDVLDNIVDKYNNSVHETIKMKPIDVTDHSYAKYNANPNKKSPKFKAGYHVRISKYKNILLKDILQIGLKKFLLLGKSDLNGQEITGRFYEKELQKTSQKKIRIEKVL